MLLALATALSAVTAVVVDLRRAQAAADLAALAGAAAVPGEPRCAAAARVARRNGAELTGCAETGREVVLSVVVAGSGWRGLVAHPSARARAGPV